MTPEAAGAIALKAGIELVVRETHKGIPGIIKWLKGRKILVIGQPRAGKTSFVRYFQYGHFTDPKKKSPRTRENTPTEAFTVAMGRDKTLQINVGQAIDTVGQISAAAHAGLVGSYKPHALLILLDLSGQWNGNNEYAAKFYLEEFCDHLSQILIDMPALRKRLASITVILSKQDLVDQSTIDAWKKHIDTIIADRLSHAYGPRARDIPVSECTLVHGANEGKLADDIITDLALSLI